MKIEFFVEEVFRAREFKFRAWSKEESQMFDVFGFDHNHVYPVTTSGITIPPTIEEVELMQYIGVRDRRGKEVFEQDIVKVYRKTSGGYSRVAIGRVVFVECRGCYFLAELTSNGGVTQLGPNDILNCEVVGNAFEHPEFLSCDEADLIWATDLCQSYNVSAMWIVEKLNKYVSEGIKNKKARDKLHDELFRAESMSAKAIRMLKK